MLDMRKFMASIRRSTPTNEKLIMMYYSLLRKEILSLTRINLEYIREMKRIHKASKYKHCTISIIKEFLKFTSQIENEMVIFRSKDS
jgi:hypothetical protein